MESVKSASDIYAPVSGTVSTTNGVLEEKPGELNRDPEGEGWIAKLDVSGPEAMEGGEEPLMSAEEYKKFTEEVEGEE